MASHNPAKFSGHGHCSNIMVLVSYVILQDHMTKGLGDFIGRSTER